MVAFTAGQKLGASDLNSIIAMAYTTADQSRISSTTLVDATGLSFVLAANSDYCMDGHLAYYGLDAVDIRVAWTGPVGMTVCWSFFAIDSTATSQTSSINTGTAIVYGDANFAILGTETDTAISCRPSGFWRTGATAGTLQLRWAQNVSNATAATILRGSWLSLVKVA